MSDLRTFILHKIELMRRAILFPLFLFTLICTLFSCMKSEHVDLIIHNGTIHSVDGEMNTFEAMAIKDGKVVELGPEREILNHYSADEFIDLQKRHVYPGLTDAHGHILSYALMKLSVNLFGATSLDDVIQRTIDYQKMHNREFVVGRGWDQSLWGQEALPTNKELNEAFPNVPVCLVRVDGHAMIANQKALEMAKIDASTVVEGGVVAVKNGQPTGLLIDNAMELMNEIIPDFSDEEMLATMNEIQQNLLEYGIVGVHEAGIRNKQLPLIKKWVESGDLKINLYGMLSHEDDNMDLAKKGPFTWGSFDVRSFKLYADGALGSHGALLKEPYHDEHDNLGILTTPIDDMENLAQFCLEYGFQLNSHAIGDSANKILLDVYQVAHQENPDHRWRIEHAQVVDQKDFELFAQYGVLPSVQPTHAVTDQRWAETRLGKERLEGAYAYQTLLNQTQMLLLGTDFPVEQINPFLTVHAAVQRKNQDNFPEEGFLNKEAISLEDCIRGMTIWPAVGSFAENERGSLEQGKEATFVVLDKPISAEKEFIENFALLTVIRGEKVLNQL